MRSDPPPPLKGFVVGLAVRVIADDAIMLGERTRPPERHGPRSASPDYLRYFT